MAWGLMCCRGEVCVTQATASASHQQHVLFARDKVGNEITTLCIKDRRSRWHANHQVAASLTVRGLVSAAAGVSCNVATLHLKVTQRGLAGVNRYVNAAAAAAISAIGTAAWHVGFAPHG